MSAAPLFALETVMPFLFAGIIFAVFGLIIWSSIKQARKARENLHALATTLSLGVDEPGKKGALSLGSTSLQGDIRGRTARVHAYTTGSGKSRASWCALSVSAAVPDGFMLRISSENLLTKAGRMFGFEDVATGDPAFDEKFHIKATQVGYIRAALIPEVRMRMIESWTHLGAHGSFTVDAGGIKYAETGVFSDGKVCARFPELLGIACDLAEIAEACRD